MYRLLINTVGRAGLWAVYGGVCAIGLAVAYGVVWLMWSWPDLSEASKRCRGIVDQKMGAVCVQRAMEAIKLERQEREADKQ